MNNEQKARMSTLRTKLYREKLTMDELSELNTLENEARNQRLF